MPAKTFAEADVVVDAPTIQVIKICEEQRKTLLENQDYQALTRFDLAAREAHIAVPKAVELLTRTLRQTHPEVKISIEHDLHHIEWWFTLECDTSLEEQEMQIKKLLRTLQDSFNYLWFGIRPVARRQLRLL